jgi:DNA-binding transcriptional LysR family regulator
MRHDDLRLFLEIAERRNMRRAAEHLGTTQSALTKAVRRLETELRMPLFDRAPRGVELTGAGRAFLNRVKPVELQLSQAISEIEHMRMGELGIVRFGCSAAYFDSLARPVISRFLKSRPQARFVLMLDVATRLTDELLQGNLDLILAGPPGYSVAEAEVRPMMEQSMHAVVRAGHPLLNANTTATDLARCSWMLPPPRRIMRRWIEEKMSELGLAPPRVALETDATIALMSPLLRESDLVGVMTKSMLESPNGAGLRPLDHLIPSSTDSLVSMWRRDSYLSPLVRDFRDALREMTT